MSIVTAVIFSIFCLGVGMDLAAAPGTDSETIGNSLIVITLCIGIGLGIGRLIYG